MLQSLDRWVEMDLRQGFEKLKVYFTQEIAQLVQIHGDRDVPMQAS